MKIKLVIQLIIVASSFSVLGQESSKQKLAESSLEFVTETGSYTLKNSSLEIVGGRDGKSKNLLLQYIDAQGASEHHISFRNSSRNSMSKFVHVVTNATTAQENIFSISENDDYRIGDEVVWRVLSNYIDGRKSLQLYKGIIGSTKQSISDGLLYNSLALSTFPNPFTTELNIKFTASGSEEAYFEVFDLQGKKMYNSKAQKLNQGSFVQETVDTASWTAGMYIIKTYDGNGESNTQKVIKQ